VKRYSIIKGLKDSNPWRRRRTTFAARIPSTTIIVDENRYITRILAATFGLKGFEVYKAYSTKEGLNKVNELGVK
jgi:ActR/RegA family two-component response regulator